jgi:hypothetical protein
VCAQLERRPRPRGRVRGSKRGPHGADERRRKAGGSAAPPDQDLQLRATRGDALQSRYGHAPKTRNGDQGEIVPEVGAEHSAAQDASTGADYEPAARLEHMRNRHDARRSDREPSRNLSRAGRAVKLHAHDDRIGALLAVAATRDGDHRANDRGAGSAHGGGAEVARTTNAGSCSFTARSLRPSTRSSKSSSASRPMLWRGWLIVVIDRCRNAATKMLS